VINPYAILNDGVSKDKVGGIGLDNIKRRLELIYPDQFDFKIDQSSQEFMVSLIIKKI
jgi:sensor histidine kinase YesM